MPERSDPGASSLEQQVWEIIDLRLEEMVSESRMIVGVQSFMEAQEMIELVEQGASL